MNKALVILSGGQDSTYCLAWAVKLYDEVAAITFNYGQRHAREIEAAKAVAKLMGVTNHEIINLGDGILQGTSPLTNKEVVLEQYQDYKQMDEVIGSRIEKTFVPMRNALFLTIAANRAVCLEADHMVTGVCEQDNANYPDCRLDFILIQQAAINAALGRGVTVMPLIIDTPLIRKTKAQAIVEMYQQGSYPLLAFTHTAYDGQYPPVGHDHATLLRAEGFREAGLPDPLIIRAWQEGALVGGLPDTQNYQSFIGSDFLGQLVQDITEMQIELHSQPGALA